tara:strand:+ start:239 stop:502 length:264 start_codon:yes stop_codon:yes gene_type:complete
MTVYQKALEALKECVKDAMDSNVDANTQGEIWRHYQGMKAIEKQIGRSSMSFKLDGIDRVMDYDPDYNIVAGQPVDLNVGNDVITFS